MCSWNDKKTFLEKKFVQIPWGFASDIKFSLENGVHVLWRIFIENFKILALDAAKFLKYVDWNYWINGFTKCLFQMFKKTIKFYQLNQIQCGKFTGFFEGFFKIFWKDISQNR